MKQYKLAALLIIIHGGFMELGGFFAYLPTLITGVDYGTSQFISFILPAFQTNIDLVVLSGGIYGIIRIIGAIGLLKNRMWGFVLSIINCVVTLCLMLFMLPAGIMDGLLSGTALVLMLTQYFGKRTIK